MSKKTAIAVSVVFAVIIAAMAALIPVQRKAEFNEKWGKLAELYEIDERAKYIIDNEELYPDWILNIFYKDNDELDFVYNYAFHGNDYASMEYTDEELNSELPPALYMADNRWAYQPIGGMTIKTGGCAAVSLTMAYLYLTHKPDTNPYKIAQIADRTPEEELTIMSGMSQTDIIAAAEELGLTVIEHRYFKDNEKTGNITKEELVEMLDSGHAVMAGLLGETFGSHAVIIAGYTDEGFIINDPASEENTAKVWKYEELADEIYYLWELSC